MVTADLTSLTPRYSSSRAAGWSKVVYAVANIRGGGEYGKAWHIAGTKLNKQNVFDDFIAAAEYLIEKTTHARKTCHTRWFKRWLLVAVAMLQRPDLLQLHYRPCVLDMLRYHKFTAGAGCSHDYGTADDDLAMFNYLKQYSPVHNVKAGMSYL